MCISGIYKIENLVNGKVYIGSTQNIPIRFYNHKRELMLNCHANGYLQNSWNKYGEDNFCFLVLEYVENLDLLILMEQKYIDEVPKELRYNIAPIAGTNRGVKHTEESKRRMSEGSKGIKHSEETRKKLSEINTGSGNGFFGKQHKQQTKDMISDKKDKKTVYQLSKETGEIVNSFPSIREAERLTGISHTSISKVCNRRMKTTAGFVWCFEKDLSDIDYILNNLDDRCRRGK